MPSSQLTPLQERVLVLLAELQPPWTLTGGGALAGVHFGHRATRDLDLFWHGRAELGPLTSDVTLRLVRAGLRVEPVQTALAFTRLQVSDASDSVLLDLVADRAPVVEGPEPRTVGGVQVLVDTRHEILVNKLCTLLGRKELRDLRDVQELLERGGDLDRAVRDAPRKDGGFSPLMLAWILRGTSVRDLAPVGGLGETELTRLESFRVDLVARLTRLAAPG